MSAVGAVSGFLAWPQDTGVAGGAVAAVVMGVPAYVRARVAARRRHAEGLAQSERHHAERLAQGLRDTAAAQRHHEQLLDQGAAQHEALKAHLTATLRLPARRAAAKDGM